MPGLLLDYFTVRELLSLSEIGKRP
ncbi:hypothetical protein RHECNPAF_13300105 [Rhizobium etli CNPAF512]|nr:hypothetical protein RHECNPAF_13300105 [Rhizobium etli CNPAF512]